MWPRDLEIIPTPAFWQNSQTSSTYVERPKSEHWYHMHDLPSLPLQLHVCTCVRAHTHIHTHLLVTWTSWRQNSRHRLMSLAECVNAPPMLERCKWIQGKKTSSKERHQVCRGCSLLITFSCLLFVPSPICTCNYLFTPGSVQVLLIPFQERSAYVFPRINSLLELWIQIPTWQLLVFLIV